MADWYVRFREFAEDAQGNIVGEFSVQGLNAEIRNSEPGGFSGELALSQKWRRSTTRGITRDSFAPYRTHYELWRTDDIGGLGVCISAGMLTSVNLNFNRDTILISGKDWIHYLQRRVYPFNPILYKNGEWINWPRTWPDIKGAYGPSHYDPTPPLNGQLTDPIDVSIIVREILQSTQYEPPSNTVLPVTGPIHSQQWPGGAAPTPGRVRITQNIQEIGETTKYKIYPGDSTSIYDHIKKLSEQIEAGFEFDIHPLSREFRLWSPRRNSDLVASYYQFSGGHDFEELGMVTEFDWTNDGPEGTYLIGLAKKGKSVGQIWTTEDNVNEFGRLDKVYDFGEVSNDTMILELLKDQNDLHPQKRLQLAVLNPEFLDLNFYTGGRPRTMLGSMITAVQEFPPYHTVSANFRVNAIKWDVEESSNENVSLELEMVYY